MKIDKIRVYRQGKPAELDAVTVGDTQVAIQGTLPRLAVVPNEWINSAHNPTEIIRVLRQEALADIFVFWELFPESSLRHAFPMELVPISALPITSHDEWLSDQIRKEVRKNIKKAARRGVEIRRVEFNDSLVSGMTRIFNEAKVRQGKPFWHYGKTVENVKDEMGQDLHRSHFIGAYFEDELIGFYKLIIERCFAQPVMSLSMIRHRDKYADTALISEAVRLCAEYRLQYMTYDEWRRDNHKEFLESHGFSRLLVPRYYVPLTYRGSVCLKLKTHKGLKQAVRGLLPDSLLSVALRLRSRWYQLALRPPTHVELDTTIKG